MQFFKHMSNMRHDPKVKRLIRRYKANGYAVYNYILESITEGIGTDTPLPILEDNVNDISHELGIPETEIEEIVFYCSKEGLLQIVSDTGIVYCVKIYKYLNTSQTRSDYIRELIKEFSGKDQKKLGYNDIKHKIEKAILLHVKELQGETDARLLSSETVLDFCEDKMRLDEIKLDKDKEKSDSPSFGKFPGSKPIVSEFDNQPTLDSLITESIAHWNTYPNLPPCPYTVLTLPDIAQVKVKFDVFRNGEILSAIKNLSECYEKIESKYRPSAFHKFIINSLDSWLDSANPQEKFKDGSESKKQTVFEEVEW